MGKAHEKIRCTAKGQEGPGIDFSSEELKHGP